MKRSVFLLTVSALVLLLSCSKNDSLDAPVLAKPQVAVALTKQYLDGTKIDSAVAVWEVSGQRKTVKMQPKNDSLFADVTQFQTGNGKISLEIFSRIKLKNHYKLQWVYQKEVTLSHSNAINITGPSGYNDIKWLPRVRLEDVNNHVAVVGLRPEDPYFLIKNVPNDVLELSVAREYWKSTGGMQKVGGGEFKCTNGCKDANGNVENTTFFRNLPQQIGNLPWNHLEIAVMYTTNANGSGTFLMLTHNVD